MTRLACAAALLLFAQVATAATYEVAMPPKEGEKYKSADFRLWVPDDAKTVRAVIVRQHGCGRNGIDHADDLQWQALAARHGCALLGTHYTTHKECKEWFDPALGSERAFLEALKHFAKESKRPELPLVPWAIWGHSGGALWACNMTNRHPERVVAVWARSQAATKFVDDALRVPIVFNYGTGEKEGKFEAVHKNSSEAFANYRAKGAVWALAVDPKSSHDCRDSRLLAVRFFDKLLAARLPKEGAKLNPVHEELFWRGEAEKLDILSPEISRGNPLKDSWLIDKEFAAAWQEYCKTGEVKDATAPAAPTITRSQVTNRGVILEWKAVADVESGIKEFVVYRDGKKLATVGGEKTKGNPKGFVQVWNYGDEPEPRAPKFQFIDMENDGGKYEVTAVNHAGLESKKSETANAK